MRWRALIIVAVAASLLALVAPAAGQQSFTFEGRGFGHGVGMSQHGARGAAEAGWDARRILSHYYRGTDLSAVPAREVRVQLRPASVSVTLGGAGLVASGPGLATTPVPDGATARVRGGDVAVDGPGGAELVRGSEVVVTGADGVAELDGGAYRGTLHLTRSGSSRVRVVNRLDLEQYLYGVVPREVPASWPAEALRAQAIAARSYAIGQLRPDRDFDVHPDTRSQVYGGRDGEHPRTTAAVDATRAQAVTHEGSVVSTFFHASSGGHTESVENVWSSDPRPYLVGVPDPFDAAGSPHRRWPDPPRFTGEELGARLGLGAAVTSVEVLERGVSPRVRRARITTADGRRTIVTGATLRARLGLRDTWFAVNEAPPAGPAASRAPTSPPSSAVRYIAYAAAPVSVARARAIERRLRRLGKDVVLVRRRVGPSTRHLVVTGHFRVLANARAERDDLRARGFRGARVGAATARRVSRAYLVSAGARFTRRGARALAARLRADGVNPRVVVRRRGARRAFLVVRGRYGTLTAAKAARADLRAKGYRGAMVGPARARS